MSIADWFHRIFVGTPEIPSIADILPRSSITITGCKITADYSVGKGNIPFTRDPTILALAEIPDFNSMDGIFDKGNDVPYLRPADYENHQIMVDWIAQQWEKSKGMLTVDAAYRMMVNVMDDPYDFTKPNKDKGYAIHRLMKVGYDVYGRYFIFQGTNNSRPDPYIVRDGNILYLSTGVIY